MPNYKYTANKLDGKKVSGTMRTADKQELRSSLLETGLYLVDAEEQAETRNIKRLKPKELSEFCREMGSLLGAGVPLVRVLSIMAQRDISPKLQKIYAELYQSLLRGELLSEAMESLNPAFPELIINMFKASEQTGQMDGTCQNMAIHYEKSHKLSKKVKSAMTYPIILGVVTVIVLLVVFLVVLPEFFKLFSDMDTELPGITQMMFDFSRFLSENVLTIACVIAAIAIGISFLKKIPSVKVVWDRTKLKMPVVGKLLRVIYTARFARTFSSTYSSGLSIISALQSSKDTIGNAYISAQFPELIQNVRNGETLADSLTKVDGLDNKLSATVMIGEETGKLDDMLNSAANFYDYDSEVALTRLTALVEPCMIVILAVVVGLIIVSVMLPLTTLYDSLGAMA